MSEEETKMSKEELQEIIKAANKLSKGITKNDLIEIVYEFNDLMTPTPPLATKGTRVDIFGEIVEAITILEEGDYLTQSTMDVINQLGMGEYMKKAGVTLLENTTEEPEPEPEVEDLESEEEVEEEMIEEEVEAEMIEEEVEEDEPEPEEPEEKITDALDIDELATLVARKTLEMKSSKIRSTQSPSKISFPIACEHIDVNFGEFCALVEEKTGVACDKLTKPGMRTAHSTVQRVIVLLREYGHMPKKKAAPKKTVAEK